MIPLIPPDDLKANPSFAKVWEYVTTQLLESDGSTRRENEARLRAWQAERLAQRPPRSKSESMLSDDGEEDGEGESVAGDERPAGRDDEKGAETPDLEGLLHAARVGRMKKVILREVLGEVAYLSDNVKTTGGELERKVKSHSHIPVRAKFELVDVTSNGNGDDEREEELATMVKEEHNVNTGMDGLAGLRDLILIISAYLDASFDNPSNSIFSSEKQDLLSNDIDRFKESISIIARAMSARLNDLESCISSIANLAVDNSNSGDQSRHPASSLSDTIQIQLAELHTLRTSTLPTSLSTLTTTLLSLLAVQRTLLHLQLQHLETSKHGVLSRYHASKIAFLSTVAQTMALKTQVMVLEARREIEMSPEVERSRAEMRTKTQEMEKEEGGLDERIRVLEEVLGEYEALDPGGKSDRGGVEVMRKLGLRYREIENEMEGIKGDIEMLERKGRV